MADIDYKKRNKELVTMLAGILDGRVHPELQLHRLWISHLINNNTEVETVKHKTIEPKKINNSLVVKG